jgi:hypothetical protein
MSVLSAAGAVRCSKDETAASDDRGFRNVKASPPDFAHLLTALMITFLLVLAALSLTGAAVAQESVARPEPNVQRQIDQLERQGSVDPLTRRQLQDQLRRQPQGPRRWSAERRLQRLPESAPAADDPLPEAPSSSDSLPSSLRPGFGGSNGGGSGGGPGTGGYQVPPGGRTGAAR